MNKVHELRDQRGKLVADMRAMLDKAEAEKRDLNAEESNAYDAMCAQQDSLGQRIVREERQMQLDRESAARVADERKPENDAKREGVIAPTRATLEGLDKFFRGLRESLGVEARAVLQSGLDAGGGFLLPQEQMIDQLIQNVDDLVFIRQRATKFRVPTAESLGVPSFDTDAGDADWTTELATGSEDTAMAFGRRALHPHPFAKRIKVSKDLLARLPSIESFVQSRLAYKFAVTEEKGFMTGTGVMQPLGLFTPSTDGIPTTRDVSTGNTTTGITFDGLIEAKYSVKSVYWNRCDWIFHRDAVKQVVKLKDGDGQYIWRESVRAGEPDMLLGRPLTISEFAPNTFTTGLYVGIFGDLSNYWVADAMDLELQRLVELYAETNQVGIIGRAKVDGMPVLAEAFARVKLG